MQLPSEGGTKALEDGGARRRKPNGTGGVARTFYTEQPPSAVRSKAVASKIYTVHFFEKQTLKIYYYSLGDAQIHRCVQVAKVARFNTDAQLLRLFKWRLDFVLNLTRFDKTPMQARKWIFDGRLWLNGRRRDIKSCRVASGFWNCARGLMSVRLLHGCTGGGCVDKG